MNYQAAINLLKNTTPLRLTVSGDIGAGKSSFSKRLAADLDIPRIYIGGLMREEATRRGISLDELNVILETDDQLDRALDALQKDKARETERGVFEGRLAWHFVENPDVTVFLSVDPLVAAERIWNDTKNQNRDKYESKEDLRDANIARKTSEEARYKKYYDISAYDEKNFDIYLDTTGMNLEEEYQAAVIALAEHIKANS